MLIVLGALVIFVHTSDWGIYSTWVTYISPIERLFEYMIGMTVCMMLKDVQPKKEPFPGCLLLVVISYLCLIKFSGLHWEFIFIHPFILAAIWTYQSKSLNAVFGNKVILSFASAGMFIYLSHNAIKMAIPGEWWVKTIACVIIGFLLNEVYQYVFNKLRICNNH